MHADDAEWDAWRPEEAAARLAGVEAPWHVASIRLPYDELIEHTADGIPYERPEVTLLFKAKHARPKDESDLAAVLPRLSAERRQLAAAWIALVHPGHFWLPDLA